MKTMNELIKEYLDEGNECPGMNAQCLLETRCDHITDLTKHVINEAMHVRAVEGLKALYRELFMISHGGMDPEETARQLQAYEKASTPEEKQAIQAETKRYNEECFARMGL